MIDLLNCLISFMGKLVTLYSVDKNDDSLDKLPYFVVNDKEKFYSVVESLGLNTIKTSKKEYFSNILNV